MKKPLSAKRYAGTLLVGGFFLTYLFLVPQKSGSAISSLMNQGYTMITLLPPIFLLIGLLDVWVPREVLIRFMGHEAGIRGGILAFVLGSVAAGPLYGAFPIAAILMAKGSSYRNVMIFIGAWSTTKIPMILFEIASLGPRLALTRLLVSIVGIIIIAILLDRIVPRDQKKCTQPGVLE